MSFGNRIISSRKKRKVSRSDLALEIGVHPNVLGRYERDESFPSVEVAGKIATALSISLDYLTEHINTELDSVILSRINDIASLPDAEKQQVFYVVDALVRDFKAKYEKDKIPTRG